MGSEIWVEIKANIQDFKDKMAETAESLEATTKKYEKLSAGLMAAGKKMAIAGGVITGALGIGVKAAMEYEKQLAQVSTMLDKDALPIMGEYRKGIQRLAKDFGEGTDTLSRGLYDILSASVDATKALDVLEVSAKAATAGITDTGVAADAITTIMNSYGMEADDAGDISDKLFAIVKRGKLTFNELAPSIGTVAATAAKSGLAFEDLGAMIMTMTRAGIRTDEAMTSINGVMAAFLKPGEEAQEMAKKFGLELSTATLKSEGMTGVLEKLKDATAEQLAVIFPNIRGLRGLMAAIGDTTGYMEDYELMMNSANLTQDAFDKQSQTLAFRMAQLKQTFLATAVEVGDVLAPAVKKATKLIQSMVEWWDNLSPALKKTIIIASAVTGGLLTIGGILSMLAAKVIPMVVVGVKALTAAVGVLHVALGPISIALAAITVGIIGINKAIGAWEKRQEKILGQKMEEKKAEAMGKLEARQRDLRKELEAGNITQEEYEERAGRIEKQIARLTGKLEEYNKKIEERGKAEKMAAEEAEKAERRRLELLEQERAKQAEFQEWLSDIRLQTDETHYEEAMKILDEEYAEALAKAKELGRGKEEVDKLYAQKRRELYEKEHGEEIRWVEDLRKQAAEVEYANKEEELKVWYEESIKRAKDNNEAKLLIEQIYATKMARIKQEEEIEFQKWLEDARMKYGMSEYEAKLAQLERWYEEEMEMAKGNQEMMFLIEQEFQERLMELRMERIREWATNVGEIVGQIKSTLDAFYDYQGTKIRNQEQEEIDTAQQAYEERKRWIEENIADENRRAEMLGELEEGFQAQKQNIGEKATEREKELKRSMKPILIAEAIANTALAVTKALPNFIMAALAAAVGAAQVAKIQATAYAKGGKVGKDEYALIGEKGPELVKLPLGAEVYPNNMTKRILGYAEGLRAPDFASPFERIEEMIAASRPKIVVHSADPATWIEELNADVRSRMWRRGFEEMKEREEKL